MSRGAGVGRRVCAVLVLVCMVSACAQTALPVSQWFQAEDFDDTSGVSFPPISSSPEQWDRNLVRDCGEGDWIRYDSVNFGEGMFDSATVYFWQYNGWDYAGKRIVVRTGSPTGPVLASCDLGEVTGFTSAPTGVRSSEPAPTGIQSVYLTFEGAGYVCDVDRFCLSGVVTADSSDARDYYVAPYGDDANDGLSVSTPFETISAAAAVMKPGSRCNIRQGVYRETVTPHHTGLSGMPLVFQPYNGEDVYISGADSVTDWSHHSGSIYRAPMGWTMGEYRNQVLVDGAMAWIARCPDVESDFTADPWYAYLAAGNWGYLRGQIDPMLIPSRVVLWSETNQVGPLYTASTGDYNVTPAPDCFKNNPVDFFTGALIVHQGDWWANIGVVQSSSSDGTGTEFTAQMTSSFRATEHRPGFVSHQFGLLDSPNEWFIQDGYLYLWCPDGDDPSTHLVEAKRRVLGFDLSGKQHVELHGLKFLATSLTMEDSRECIVDDCHFKYVSHYETYEWYEQVANYWQTPLDPSPGYKGIFVSGERNVIRNSSVAVSAGSGIHLYGQYNTVENCRIHDCNYVHTYDAGINFGKRSVDDANECIGHRVSRNTMYNFGRSCINFDKTGYLGEPGQAQSPRRIQIVNNDFGRCGWLSGEVGALYVYGSLQPVEVANNWFHDAGGGWGHGYVYLDHSGGWVIHHNVFWEGSSVNGDKLGSSWCFETWNDHRVLAYNNTLVDRGATAVWDSTGVATYTSQDAANPGTFCYGRNNLLASYWSPTPDDTAYWRFADPDNRDYNLRAGSPAIDQGETIPGVLETYEGSAPDLGAYEAGATPWSAGADWEEEPWIYPPSPPPVNMAGQRSLARGDPRSIVRQFPGRIVVETRSGQRVCLLNAQGATVQSTRDTGQGTVPLSTRDRGSGMYFVRIRGRDFTSATRLLLRE